MLKIKMTIIVPANYISSSKIYQSTTNHVMNDKQIRMTINLWTVCMNKYFTTVHAGYIATYTHTIMNTILA